MLDALLLMASVHLSPTEAAAVIPASQVAFAACVSHRESRDSYRSRRAEADSTAAGRWQFLDRQWRVNGGLAWMVSARLRAFGMPAAEARSVRRKLQATPIYAWSPQMQDVAFVSALNGRGPWTGWRHWYLSGSRCNVLVPAGAR
jgi:hypothetical protein